MMIKKSKKLDSLGVRWAHLFSGLQRQKRFLVEKITDETIKKAVNSLTNELNPIGDIRSTAEYRKKVAGNLLNHFLNKAKAR